MKKLLVIIVISILVLMGCNNEPAVEPVSETPKTVSQPVEKVAEPVVKEPVGTCSDGKKNQDEEDIDCGGVCPDCPTCSDGMKNQDEEGIDCGGECDECKCDSTTDPSNIYSLELKNIETTAEGIKFRFFLLDKEKKEVIPSEGNLGVYVWSTGLDGNNEVEMGSEIFAKSIYIKKDKVLADCAYPEILVTYDDIESHNSYKNEGDSIRDGDQGLLRVVFRRSGGHEYIDEVFGEDDINFIP